MLIYLAGACKVPKNQSIFPSVSLKFVSYELFLPLSGVEKDWKINKKFWSSLVQVRKATTTSRYVPAILKFFQKLSIIALIKWILVCINVCELTNFRLIASERAAENLCHPLIHCWSKLDILINNF